MDSLIVEKKRAFAEFMVEAGVLTFGDFTTKSGRKSPYFINTGNYKTGAQIQRLGSFYADCINDQVKDEITVLFGPAYKGIPLVVATVIALEQRHHRNLPYCFNRKEAKDHGEGGSLIGHKVTDGDRILIIEDVITAGTAVREVLPMLQSLGNVHVPAMVLSVDRMERGQGDKTAVQELYDDYGIKVYPLITIREIVALLHNVAIAGQIVLNDPMRESIEDYLKSHCVG